MGVCKILEENKMEVMEAIRNRHSVRQYTNNPIEAEIIKALQDEIIERTEQSFN